MDLTRRSVLGLAAAVVASGVTGCTPTDDRITSPSPTPTVDATAPIDIHAVDRERLLDSGTLRLRIAVLPQHWNPWRSDASAAVLGAAGLLYGQWFHRDGAGRCRPNPDYVAEVHATHERVTEVRLTINAQAVWGDGAPVTATDWVATHAAVRWPGVAEVKQGASEREIIIRFASLTPDWEKPLSAGPGRAAAMASSVFNTGWGFPKKEWCAGPFIVTHLDVVQQLVTLERNPHWWGAPSRLSRVSLRVVPDDGVMAAFAAHEFDVLPVPLAAAATAQIRTISDVQLRQAPGPQGRVLVMRSTGVLADLKVRQAIVRSFDRKALAVAGLEGITDQHTPWAHPLLLTNHPGYSNRADAAGLGFNLKAAAAALSEAGWWLENDVRVKNGTRLRVSVTVPDGDARASQEARVLTDGLEDIGIEVARVSKNGDVEFRTDTFDAWPLAAVRQRFGSDPQLKGFAEAIATAVDPVRRVEQATQAGQLLMQRCEVVPLYQEPQLVAARGQLANIGAPGFGTIDWTSVGWTR